MEVSVGENVYLGEIIGGLGAWAFAMELGQFFPLLDTWAFKEYFEAATILRSSHYLMDGLLFFRRFFAFAAKDTQILIHHIHNRFQPVPFHYISSINPLFLLS